LVEVKLTRNWQKARPKIREGNQQNGLAGQIEREIMPAVASITQ